jgi:hypothetical protein
LESKIIEGQKIDKGIFRIKEKMKRELTKHFRVDEQGLLWFKDLLVVPKDRKLKNKLMDEAHHSKLFIHPGSSKMYQELKPRYWWTKTKKEIAVYEISLDSLSLSLTLPHTRSSTPSCSLFLRILKGWL